MISATVGWVTDPCKRTLAAFILVAITTKKKLTFKQAGALTRSMVGLKLRTSPSAAANVRHAEEAATTAEEPEPEQVSHDL